MANGAAGASGALSGAASGAAIGSVVPGIGTAIGAVGGGIIGGVAGLMSGGGDPDSALAPIVDPVTGEQINRSDANVQSALAQQQAFINAANAQGGFSNQANIFNQQQALANQFQLQSQGQGPNPAMAQFANNTGANMQQQAALMASQRGASANAGLMARQIGMQGANVQQQAAGQQAVMQANQQLAAQHALQQQQQMMGGLATQQVGQQQQAVAQGNQFAQGYQQNLLNAQGQYNNALVSSFNNSDDNDTKKQMASDARSAGAVGGALNAAGAVAGMYAKSGGGGGSTAPSVDTSGWTHEYAKGGMVEGNPHGPQSFIGKYFKDGGVVQGKADVKGDSPKNDTVSAKLSPGEVVIPRSVMQSKDPAGAAAKFVQAILAKKGK